MKAKFRVFLASAHIEHSRLHSLSLRLLHTWFLDSPTHSPEPQGLQDPLEWKKELFLFSELHSSSWKVN